MVAFSPFHFHLVRRGQLFVWTSLSASSSNTLNTTHWWFLACQQPCSHARNHISLLSIVLYQQHHTTYYYFRPIPPPSRMQMRKRHTVNNDHASMVKIKSPCVGQIEVVIIRIIMSLWLAPVAAAAMVLPPPPPSHNKQASQPSSSPAPSHPKQRNSQEPYTSKTDATVKEHPDQQAITPHRATPQKPEKGTAPTAGQST